MTRLPLPVLDDTRTEFCFERVACACDACAVSCRHVPGYLVPSDLSRIVAQHRHGMDAFSWVRTFLLASPGALVAQNGLVFRIHTLVPARRDDGSCVFLTQDGNCSIHSVAPFGCAFFDSHMSRVQSDHRSLHGLRAVAEAWQAGTIYSAIWMLLHQAGRRVPAPEEARRRMRNAALHSPGRRKA